MERPVIGIDASAGKLALVCLDGDQATLDTYVLGSPFTPFIPERAYASVSEFMQSVTRDDVPRVFLEAPVVAGARNIQTTIKQAMVSGAIQTAVAEWGEQVILVPVSSWKAGIGAGGRASKQTVAEWLYIHHPQLSTLCVMDQDLIDASCIAVYGRDVLARSSRMDGERSVQATHTPVLHVTRVHIGL